MILALDASMALAWFFERGKPAEAELAIAAARALQEGSAVVPHIWHTEVINGALAGERRKVTSEVQTANFLAHLSSLPIQTDESFFDSRRETILALARRHSLTAYDATYLELALRRSGTMASFDTGPIKAA